MVVVVEAKTNGGGVQRIGVRVDEAARVSRASRTPLQVIRYHDKGVSWC